MNGGELVLVPCRAGTAIPPWPKWCTHHGRKQPACAQCTPDAEATKPLLPCHTLKTALKTLVTFHRLMRETGPSFIEEVRPRPGLGVGFLGLSLLPLLWAGQDLVAPTVPSGRRAGLLGGDVTGYGSRCGWTTAPCASCIAFVSRLYMDQAALHSSPVS